MMKNLSLAAATVLAATIPLTGAAIAEQVMDLGVDVGADRPPDRLSVENSSPFFDPCYARVAVRLNGEERRGDVQEYCMSEGWILTRIFGTSGKFKIDGEGRYVLKKLTGAVVAYWKDGRPTRRSAPAYRQPPEAAQVALDAAAAKRARKAGKLRKGLSDASNT
jgi:hypothetical protein